MLNELASDNLQEVVANNSKVVVQYSAGWCGNCRIMKPKMKKLAAANEDIHFIVVDAENYPNARQLANVDNLPTFATFKNGTILNQVQTNKFDLLKELVDEIAHH